MNKKQTLKAEQKKIIQFLDMSSIEVMIWFGYCIEN